MIEFDERKPWNRAGILLLTGPGGADKSSLGQELARLLKLRLIDLDHEFRHRVGDITFVPVILSMQASAIWWFSAASSRDTASAVARHFSAED